MKEGNQEENEYIGNIWGWKYSMYGLYIILFFMSIALARYIYLVATDQYPVEYEKYDLLDNNNPHLKKDTTKIK